MFSDTKTIESSTDFDDYTLKEMKIMKGVKENMDLQSKRGLK
jgi:hypothetical protein